MNSLKKYNLIKKLVKMSPEKNTQYTKQEIIDMLKRLQYKMSKNVFDKTGETNKRPREIMVSFEKLADKYNLNELKEYKRYKENMNELGFTIGTFIKGLNGEREAQNALKVLKRENDIEILHNVVLKNDDFCTEYDSIVITKFGIFVVEVKNVRPRVTLTENGILQKNFVLCDIPEKLAIKEALLKEYLGDKYMQNFHSIIMFPDPSTEVIDNYKKIPICVGKGIAYKIKELFSNESLLTEDEISEAKKCLLEKGHENKEESCPVNCYEIISDYVKCLDYIDNCESGIRNQAVKDSRKVNNNKSKFKLAESDKGKLIANTAVGKLRKVLMFTLPGLMFVLIRSILNNLIIKKGEN